MDEEVWVRMFEGAEGTRDGTTEWILQPQLRDTGIFLLEAKVETPDGVLRRTFYFLRLPKLERPRLLARRSQLE